MENLTERLTELEIRYSHQTRLIDELHEELVGANERIDALTRDLHELREALGSLGADFQQSPDE